MLSVCPDAFFVMHFIANNCTEVTCTGSFRGQGRVAGLGGGGGRPSPSLKRIKAY